MNVVLSHPEGEDIHGEEAESLMDVIIDHAEAVGLSVGGGMIPFSEATLTRKREDPWSGLSDEELSYQVAVRVMGQQPNPEGRSERPWTSREAALDLLEPKVLLEDAAGS